MGVKIMPQSSWSVPLPNGRSLEFHRVICHFQLRRAGSEPEAVETVPLPVPAGGGKKLLHADAYISGFDTWYEPGKGDHEFMRLNFDAFIQKVFQVERTIELRLRFRLTDEDTGDNDDFNEAWLGLMIIAHSE